MSGCRECGGPLNTYLSGCGACLQRMDEIITDIERQRSARQQQAVADILGLDCESVTTPTPMSAPEMEEEIEASLNAPDAMRESLFRPGSFRLHSGAESTWKIECDALTDDDWRALARMAIEILPPFRAVVSPGGAGDRFAAALRLFVSPDAGCVLIADDVLTTGASMEAMRQSSGDIGVVAFARGPVPEWVTPLWTLGQRNAPAAACGCREKALAVACDFCAHDGREHGELLNEATSLCSVDG